MSTEPDNNLTLKFLAIGDSGVGKTCFLGRYVDGQVNENLAPTVGIDILNRNLTYESTGTKKVYNIHLQLWDTAGQERFRSLTTPFFRDAIGFLLLFDLTNETSFTNARNWITEIQNNAYSVEVDMILIGNKCDLLDDRVISKTDAIRFAKEYNVNYLETSALKCINIEEAVKSLLDSVMTRLEQNQNLPKPNQSLLRPPTEKINQLVAESNARTKPKVSFCCAY